MDALLPLVVGALRPYVDRSVIASTAGQPLAATRHRRMGSRRPRRYTAPSASPLAAQAADEEMERGETGEGGGVDNRVARLLGKIGGAAHALVDDGEGKTHTTIPPRSGTRARGSRSISP